jgi:ketosteroid isomerase-like protein
MDGLAETYDPDVVVWHPEDWPEPGPSVGREAAMAQYRRLRDAWGDTRVVEEELRAEVNWVVVRFRLITEGSDSGIVIDQQLSAGYRLKESKIAEVRFSWSHTKVLEAAGLLDSHLE